MWFLWNVGQFRIQQKTLRVFFAILDSEDASLNYDLVFLDKNISKV